MAATFNYTPNTYTATYNITWTDTNDIYNYFVPPAVPKRRLRETDEQRKRREERRQRRKVSDTLSNRAETVF